MIIVLPASTSKGSKALLLKKGSMKGQIYFLIIADPNIFNVTISITVFKLTISDFHSKDIKT